MGDYSLSEAIKLWEKERYKYPSFMDWLKILEERLKAGDSRDAIQKK